MSAPGGPDVAGLLEAHRPSIVDAGLCACGAVVSFANPALPGVSFANAHRAHRSQVIREAYADWLSAGDVRVREVLAEAMFGFPFETSDLETILAHRNLAETALSALADLLRGQA